LQLASLCISLPPRHFVPRTHWVEVVFGRGISRLLVRWHIPQGRCLQGCEWAGVYHLTTYEHTHSKVHLRLRTHIHAHAPARPHTHMHTHKCTSSNASPPVLPNPNIPQQSRAATRYRRREPPLHAIKPYTLHPIPYTLYPTLHTLNPKPYTLYPQLHTDDETTPACDQTLHSTSHTLHPTPYTPHPTPYTLYPTPYTLNYIPTTRATPA